MQASGRTCLIHRLEQNLAAVRRHRPVVLGQPFQRLERQVQAVEGRILALQPRHHLEALRVVVEAAVAGHDLGQSALAGMAERRMAEIVRQRQRLGQVLVQGQHAGDGAGDLRHLQAVGEARAVVIALVEHEHLRLVGQPPERRRMHDAVAIPLKGRAHGAGGLGVDPAGACLGPGCIGREHASISAAHCGRRPTPVVLNRTVCHPGCAWSLTGASRDLGV